MQNTGIDTKFKILQLVWVDKIRARPILGIHLEPLDTLPPEEHLCYDVDGLEDLFPETKVFETKEEYLGLLAATGSPDEQAAGHAKALQKAVATVRDNIQTGRLEVLDIKSDIDNIRTDIRAIKYTLGLLVIAVLLPALEGLAG